MSERQLQLKRNLLKIGQREFDIKKTHIMGILNITPDSFSDGGKFFSEKSALEKAEKMIKDGADVIDIGFESTNPKSVPISESEEINRLKTIGIPVIKYINNCGIPISIDTYKSKVADIAANYGVLMINDIWGFKRDPNMAKVCVKYDLACCLMHNRTSETYGDFLGELISDITKSIKIAIKEGVNEKKIIIDPGIGFAKNREEDLIALKNLQILKNLGYPLLLGVSKKRIINYLLNADCDTKTKSIGTMALTAFAVFCGCFIVRVHDVKENKVIRDVFSKLH